MPTLINHEFIAIQREVLAQRVLQAKGLADAPRAKTAIASQKRDPLRRIHEGQHCHHSFNEPNVVATGNSVSRPRSLTQQAKSISWPPATPATRSFKKGFRFGCEDDHSISTATMTTMSNEPAPPLHLPNFKPAVGCITATDFMIRCFVARLRAGVAVIKHSRSRFQTSPRTYVLKLEEDGESLTWMQASSDPDAREPSQLPQKSCTSSRFRRLNLSECREVRLAQTPDPENPAFTGSATLREKCASDARHKSFSIIFDHRTLDITSMTQDQCKWLVEGFSALCFHLQCGSREAQCERGEQTLQSSRSLI